MVIDKEHTGSQVICYHCHAAFCSRDPEAGESHPYLPPAHLSPVESVSVVAPKVFAMKKLRKTDFCTS
ncbi:MAG TPA: hypothetical protein DEB39_13090 [Planctomycetaceae bacterium]|nr:hypothetical protein [Planctomycetaceae bacterium]